MKREIECLLYDRHQKGKTHSDRRCQLRKDMGQNIVRLDEGEGDESEVTQEA